MLSLLRIFIRIHVPRLQGHILFWKTEIVHDFKKLVESSTWITIPVVYCFPVIYFESTLSGNVLNVQYFYTCIVYNVIDGYRYVYMECYR